LPFLSRFSAYRGIIPLIALIILFQAVGGTMGFLFGAGDTPWYAGLTKSPLTPPGWVFGVVWPILYLLLAYGAWVAITARGHAHHGFIVGLFAVHMILNWGWSGVFFGLQSPLIGFIVILVLLFTAAMLGFLLYGVNKKTAFVFIPYGAWLIFAGALNQFIIFNNP